MIPILDTHLHLVYPDRFQYPWLANAPAINRPWTVESYWEEARPLGIEAALHMEVDVAEADMLPETRFVLGLPGVSGAIAATRPESSDFPAHLEELAAMGGVKGIRRILHEVLDDLSQSELFRQNIRRLASVNLPFDLCVRHDQLPIGRELVAQAPDVTFILDHCGVPDVLGQGLDPWRDNIRALAQMPNVSAKISGIVAYSGPDWTLDTIRPYVEHVIECFGWDRIVWGSDHPVVTQTGSLARWVEVTRQIIGGASEDEQARLLNRNAARIYGL
jgi:predicted TIM-barrel fold metal-dependent hydrolase